MHDRVPGRQRRDQLHADRDHRAVPGEDDSDDAVRFRHGVSQLTLIRRERGDASLDLVGPTGVVGRPIGHDPDEWLAHTCRHPVVEYRQAGDLGDVALHQLAEPAKYTRPLRRPEGAPFRVRSVRGPHGGVDVVRTGQRHRPLDSPGGRVHVLMHAGRAARSRLAADVQMHGRNAQINGHRLVLGFVDSNGLRQITY